MGFRDLNIKLSYAGKGDFILRDFLLPTIHEAIYYDRVTSYYTVESLLAISHGVETLFRNKGKMRLIIGIHSFPADFVEASLCRDYLKNEIEKIRTEFTNGIASLSEKLKKDRLATLAWMIEDGLLEIKAAGVKGQGIFHSKTLILTDKNGDKIVAVGSQNETGSGLGGNFEQLMIETSWTAPDGVDTQQQCFELLWNNQHEYATVIDVSERTASMILSALGPEYQRLGSPQLNKNDSKCLLKLSSKMLANFFVSGDIPALYVHQERAVIEALSRWPVRVLFSDEVGLGKTFEVASTMAFLINNCGIRRVVILTPKSVLKQWQDELHKHFHINAWLFESENRTYYDCNGNVKFIDIKHSPISKQAPDIILMSAQYARGSGKNGDIFSHKDSIMPDLLIIDEAHSARVSKTLSGDTHKTRMYQMLEKVTRKIPHLILATATPMQKTADEYHAILKLLGLPKPWDKERTYLNSLKLILKQDPPELSDASNAAKLVLNTLNTFSPDVSKLDKNEIEVLNKLKKLQETSDQCDIGNYVIDNWGTFRSSFIKLHPAHLYTIRNTRRTLSAFGYKFPERCLIEESIENSIQIQLFLEKVDNYLSEKCFSIEQVLYPDKSKTLGFLRVSYRQRMASSLYSCKESLMRRYNKVCSLNAFIDQGNANITPVLRELYSNLDSFDFDDLLSLDMDELPSETSSDADYRELKRAIDLESTELSYLINRLNDLLNDKGDLKIIKSIQLAEKCLSNGDTVLLFSRYTDTVEALIREFKKAGLDDKYSYGVYTGQKSIIVCKDIELVCDKNRLKEELFSGNIKIVFCSDAASEGLNLQAARVLINVDVPWTPSRLEQRIGRIDRLGQIADKVQVYNVWYPNSIEARMYRRIQSRLRETNLAIGEFPDVVANSIKQAILDGNDQDDSGLEELIKIRNSNERLALEKLWIRSENVTESEIIRKDLITICNREFPSDGTSLGGQIINYIMPDKSMAKLSSKPGLQESISFKSKPWDFITFIDDRIKIIYDSCDRPAAFSYENKRINHESIFKIFLGQKITKDCLLNEYPKMLPNSNLLNLSFATDAPIPPPPKYWIEP